MTWESTRWNLARLVDATHKGSASFERQGLPFSERAIVVCLTLRRVIGMRNAREVVVRSWGIDVNSSRGSAATKLELAFDVVRPSGVRIGSDRKNSPQRANDREPHGASPRRKPGSLPPLHGHTGIQTVR